METEIKKLNSHIKRLYFWICVSVWFTSIVYYDLYRSNHFFTTTLQIQIEENYNRNMALYKALNKRYDKKELMELRISFYTILEREHKAITEEAEKIKRIIE